MAIKNNNNLFYTCSLIEYIGRQIKRKRYEVVDLLIIYMIVNIGFRITGILAKYMRD